jgi:two-component system, OmpR family, response regulator
VGAQPSVAPGTPTGAERVVLVVDDDEAIREMLASALTFAGYRVLTAADGATGMNEIARRRPDIVVLDVTLGDLDGFDLLHMLRSRGDRTPVLFLSARDTLDDKLRGLALGGDDYVTKPFSITEVAARLEAVLRRAPESTASGQPPVPATDPVLRYADLAIDEDRHLVTRGDRRVELSPTEFRLLRHLLVNRERVLSKLQILDHVWHYDFGGDVSVVEKFVSNLRRKLEEEGERPLLHTVRGFGYTLRDDGG